MSDLISATEKMREKRGYIPLPDSVMEIDGGATLSGYISQTDLQKDRNKLL